MTVKQYPLRLSEEKLNELRKEAEELDVSVNALIKMKIYKKEKKANDSTN